MSVVTTAGLATRWDWRVQQGTLSRVRLPVLDALNTLIDVTGWGVDARIKNGDGEIVHAFPAHDMTVSGFYVTLAVPPVVSLSWSSRPMTYRVKVLHPQDPIQIYRILTGRLIIDFD